MAHACGWLAGAGRLLGAHLELAAMPRPQFFSLGLTTGLLGLPLSMASGLQERVFKDVQAAHLLGPGP